MRTRRKFTDKFKQAAVRRLANAPASKVARDCGVSVSVLHRWRKRLGNHRASTPAGRRIFSKEFKESVVKRLEAGEPVNQIVRELDISPTVVRRWRHEWRKYGEAAFTGYGKSRSPAPSTRIVILRFTAGEYEGIKAVSVARRASSLPDFVRTQLLPGPSLPMPSIAEIGDRLAALIASVQDAAQNSAQVGPAQVR